MNRYSNENPCYLGNVAIKELKDWKWSERKYRTWSTDASIFDYHLQ